MEIPKLLVGQVVEIKNLAYDIRVYLNNENTIKDVMLMLENGNKLVKIWDKEGKIIYGH